MHCQQDKGFVDSPSVMMSDFMGTIKAPSPPTPLRPVRGASCVLMPSSSGCGCRLSPKFSMSCLAVLNPPNPAPMMSTTGFEESYAERATTIHLLEPKRISCCCCCCCCCWRSLLDAVNLRSYYLFGFVYLISSASTTIGKTICRLPGTAVPKIVIHS